METKNSTPNTFCINDWADKRFKECKETIECYIKDGIERASAHDMVMDNSTLGAGYKTQMRHDFGIGAE